MHSDIHTSPPQQLHHCHCTTSQVELTPGITVNKKVTFTNPYSAARTFHISTDVPRLLQLSPARLDLAPGASKPIGMSFLLPAAVAAAWQAGPGGLLQRLHVFVNDEEEQGEECYQVGARLAPPAQHL
jgi:hypothetical protein